MKNDSLQCIIPPMYLHTLMFVCIAFNTRGKCCAFTKDFTQEIEINVSFSSSTHSQSIHLYSAGGESFQRRSFHCFLMTRPQTLLPVPRTAAFCSFHTFSPYKGIQSMKKWCQVRIKASGICDHANVTNHCKIITAAPIERVHLSVLLKDKVCFLKGFFIF